jgi:glycosyltransferase involved in cell wall biosynthesis
VSRIRRDRALAAAGRPAARGKSIFLGDRKLYIRGVTYGTFAGSNGSGGFPSPRTVERDFAAMAKNGVNAVRIYTQPPSWLLDLALEHDIRVMVGLPWEDHVTFLDDRARARSIVDRVRKGVDECAGHPGVLCFTVGNEIPSSIVRWHGRRRIENFIERLFWAAKDEDPAALVSYVNYPSTEYLQLPFIDLACFNVFLETGPQYEAYVDRLQNIAGDRPLIVTETGLDSRSHSPEAQARALDWQVRSAFAAGCAGVFVFSWTDEWHRGGYEISDWDFGLTDRDRQDKPALAAVRTAFAELPFPGDLSWPKVSVVVCAYNSEPTLRDCLNGLRQLEYPSYEVIVVNDGSTDATEQIAQEFGYRVITTENQGLACARNVGLEAATGEIVAYLDADAYPDPHWLSHLAVTFMKSSHVGVGGPNIPPPDEGEVAECVANAPGGPSHVLLSDRVAEHIPGCNMAFRRASLEAIGGFDPQFRIAGDDVDICWRLQDEGWTVGFSAGAVVWHHRRPRIRTYLRQQFEYGKAEALLERKWPERYNRVGHLAWAGRVYGGATQAVGWRRWKVYYGRWGSGLFQSVYQRAPGPLSMLPLVPEWYLLLFALAGLSALGVIWTPLLLALPLFLVAAGALVLEATMGAARATFNHGPRSRLTRLRLRTLTAFLYTLQPVARLSGRLRYGLAPWRRRATALALPLPRSGSLWSEQWQSAHQRLEQLEAALKLHSCAVLQGGDYDRWDLQVRGGLLGVARLRLAVEEHGGGRQLVRFRCWPQFSRVGLALILTLGLLAAGAALSDPWFVAAVLAGAALLLAWAAVRDCATAVGVLAGALAAEPDDARAEKEKQGPEPRRAALADVGQALRRSENGRETRRVDGSPSSAPLADLPAPQVVPFSSRHE